ncbi:MAG: Plug domain-containing protein [Gemmatimonadota bacterium]
MRKRLFLLLLALALAPEVAVAQDPPPPRPAPDSVAAAPPDSLAAADTLPTFHNLPSLEDAIPAKWATGVWSWDHEQILASGANTLVELFDEVPGVVPLRAGDYGTPSAFSAFGLGAGGVRVLRDGFELLPLGGGVTDLQRIGLGGIGRIRLHREGGRLLVEMWSLEHDDGRPYSLVEAGTGDLDNNLFRGTFLAPNAFGGSLAVGLERSDSRGAARGETGSRTGSWLRYQLHRGDAAGIGLDFRRMTSRSEVADYASPSTRTDVTLRARARLGEGVVAEASAGRSSHDVDDERLFYATEGGRTTQHGLRLATEHGGLWSNAAFRLFRGDDLVENRLDLAGGWTRAGVGGATARFSREDWVGARPKSYGVRAWAGPVAGITLFGSMDSGRYGARLGPVLDVAPPEPVEPTDPTDPTVPTWSDRSDPVLYVTDRTTYRAGASFSWRGAMASAAALGVEQDPALPLGLAPDLGTAPVPGGTRRGWEAHGSIPGPLDGLRIVGSYQEWDVPAPYLPRRIYRGALDYHQTFMETGTLELRAYLGVRGHDPMQVFATPDADGAGTDLTTVPFFQSWDGRIQIRIVTVRIFVSWENAFVRRNLQAFPGRILPPLRTSYGIRWTMWN